MEDGLSVTVLGCDGSYPGPGGACSGYLVRSGATAVWVDTGPGTMANVQRHVGLADIDAVVVTHMHPDHWSDLHHLYVAYRYFVERRMPVWCGPGLDLDRYAGVLEWNPAERGSKVQIGDLLLTFSPDYTDHPVPTLAVRVDAAGRSLGYSADTGPGWKLGSLGPDLDLALCEATYTSKEKPMPVHLSAAEAGAMARQAGAARVVITHLAPGVDRDVAAAEAGEAFGRPVEVATTGVRYEV